jgi:hypothetical protein
MTDSKTKPPRSRAQNAFSSVVILMAVVVGFVVALTVVALCGAAATWAWRSALGL